MGLSFNEQVVLVTGGGRGLGTRLVKAFSREGAKVVINYRSSKEAAEALAESLGQAIAIQGDVTSKEDVARVFREAKAHFGKSVTTVVNNALAHFFFNGDARKKADDIAWPDFDAQFQGSVRGSLNTIQEAVKDMKALGFGRIINIGTNLFQNPVVPYHDYTAAKAALLSLTRTMAADLGPLGITVNMVSGGLLRTTDASSQTPEAVFDIIASQTPLQSVTSPEEFADACLFFASPWSRAVTGQNLVVDGGLVKD